MKNIVTIDRSAIGLATAANTTITPPRKGDMFIPTDSFYTMVVYDGSKWLFMHNGRALQPPQFDTNFNRTAWYHESADVNMTLDSSHVANILFDISPSYSMHAYYTAAPATPYAFTVAFLPHVQIGGFNHVGIGWRSNTGVYMPLSIGSDNGYQWLMRYDRSGLTYYIANYFSTGVPPMLVHGPLVWMRITDDGTFRKVWVSSNGINFTNYSTVSSSDGASPDNIGVMITDTTANVNTGMTIVHMSLS
jgi:hypothetical protein